MPQWSVKPSWKKSLHERQHYHKGENTFIVETTWRWGEFTVTTEDDTPPMISEYEDLYNCGYDCELVECDDGCGEDYDYDECDGETTEWLENYFEEGNSYFDLEEHGWDQGDTEMIISCEPEITKVEE
jgi:hypothetical protein